MYSACSCQQWPQPFKIKIQHHYCSTTHKFFYFDACTSFELACRKENDADERQEEDVCCVQFRLQSSVVPMETLRAQCSLYPALIHHPLFKFQAVNNPTLVQLKRANDRFLAKNLAYSRCKKKKLTDSKLILQKI